MRKIMFVIVMFATLCMASGPIRVMRNVYEKNFSVEQFDSICKADGLPRNVRSGWRTVKYIDYEDKQTHYQYLYIQKKGGKEVIYRVEHLKGDSVKVTKRVAYTR